MVFGSPYLMFRFGLPVLHWRMTTLASWLLRNLRVSQVLDVSLDTCHALRWTPADPRRTHQSRSLCVGFWAVNTIAICFRTVCTVTQFTGLYQASGSAVFLVAYVVPCVRFNCVVRLCASSTTATLGMNGWLGLIHQGLSPWKKRQASLGAPTDWLTGAERQAECPLEPVLLECNLGWGVAGGILRVIPHRGCHPGQEHLGRPTPPMGES